MTDHVDLDGTTAAWLEAAKAANVEIARLTDIRDRAIQHVKDTLGDAGEGWLNGKPVVTWTWNKPARQLDRKKLEEAYGADVIAAYDVDKKPARPFRIVEADK